METLMTRLQTIKGCSVSSLVTLSVPAKYCL